MSRFSLMVMLMTAAPCCLGWSNGPGASRKGTTATTNTNNVVQSLMSRKGFGQTGIAFLVGISLPTKAEAAGGALQESLDVSEFLRTGVDGGGNMGVSSQAGKSRPETGVVLRDGSEVNRDGRSGDVLAEILLATPVDGEPMAALARYTSPWPLAKGSFFDVECRDASTGDGVFLAVSPKMTGNDNSKNMAQIPDSFFLDSLMSPTGRFSFYGSPTDIKVKKSVTKGDKRVIDFSFSNLSQSTQTEIPRRATLVATIPKGASQAVMLVGSSTAGRWKKGTERQVESIVDSFVAIPAPQTSMKLRRKERPSYQYDE